MISNWDSRLRGILDAHALSIQFDTIVVSCEVGSEKPAPAIFDRALRALDLAPGQAVHVGDDLVSDYEGSCRAGMRGVLLVRHGEPPRGVEAVATLDGLLPLVESAR